jgi:nucleoside-diphosphate kinase
MEKTFVAVKSDAVQRGLVGEIIARFERAGLKLEGLKMMNVSKELASKHYPLDREEFVRGLGQKSLDNYQALGQDVKAVMGTDDPLELGREILKWTLEYLTSGPVVAMVIGGPHAIELVRKIVGNTLPLNAAPGTIRGDYSFDSSSLANAQKRPIKNMIHASGNLEEAEHEVKLWFRPEELVEYRRAGEDIMNS